MQKILSHSPLATLATTVCHISPWTRQFHHTFSNVLYLWLDNERKKKKAKTKRKRKRKDSCVEDSSGWSRLPFSTTRTRTKKMGQRGWRNSSTAIEPSSTLVPRQENQIKQRLEPRVPGVESVPSRRLLEEVLRASSNARNHAVEMLLQQILSLGDVYASHRAPNQDPLWPTSFIYIHEQAADLDVAGRIASNEIHSRGGNSRSSKLGAHANRRRGESWHDVDETSRKRWLITIIRYEDWLQATKKCRVGQSPSGFLSFFFFFFFNETNIRKYSKINIRRN